MKALSVRQPWCLAILRGGKRIENRDWELDGGNVSRARSLIGQTILLHASKWWSTVGVADTIEDFRDLARMSPDWPKPGEMTVAQLREQTGGIVGRARLADVVRTTPTKHRIRENENRCLLCGFADYFLLAQYCGKADPWAVPGAIGLVLADVEALPFRPLKGALGFFEVP